MAVGLGPDPAAVVAGPEAVAEAAPHTQAHELPGLQRTGPPHTDHTPGMVAMEHGLGGWPSADAVPVVLPQHLAPHIQLGSNQRPPSALWLSHGSSQPLPQLIVIPVTCCMVSHTVWPLPWS